MYKVAIAIDSILPVDLVNKHMKEGVQFTIKYNSATSNTYECEMVAELLSSIYKVLIDINQGDLESAWVQLNSSYITTY